MGGDIAFVAPFRKARTRVVAHPLRTSGRTPIARKGASVANDVPRFPGAERYLPARVTLRTLAEAAQSCRGCDLYRNATQAVFGEGAAGASLVFVGEQPGDEEDKAGHPFVGPAGRVLDRALSEAGISRDEVYVTNAVKHFKFTERGKRRMHAKPSPGEVRACRPWLEAELALLKPEVLVLLGATAAQALLGSKFRVTRFRGVPLETEWATVTFATVHPSSILRAPSDEQRHEAREAFTSDVRVVAEAWRRLQGA